MHSPKDVFVTPRIADLDLKRIANRTGTSISVLPSGAIFAIEHVRGGQTITLDQILGSPIAAGMGGLFLRTSGREPEVMSLLSPTGQIRFGAADDRFVWRGACGDFRYEVVLWLHPDIDLWFWRVGVVNGGKHQHPCDVVFVQGLGLGERGFLMNNEAYASQYIDHHVAPHPRFGPVLMARQNTAQGGSHPWSAHGCLDGAEGFATDFLDVCGPAHRDANAFTLPFGHTLTSLRLQHESACAALQSHPALLAPGEEAQWTFFGLFQPDHPAASSNVDLAAIDIVATATGAFSSKDVALSIPARSLLQDAPVAVTDALSEQAIAKLYPDRTHVETRDGQTLSFFVPSHGHSRHVVLRDKERMVARRHGALLRSGDGMLPADDLLCATAWMHGVFGAQLTIGNTSFHKLFSVSRDPYNMTRGSGLRMLVELDGAWRLLTVPSAFEMSFGECRWVLWPGSDENHDRRRRVERRAGHGLAGRRGR